MYKFPKINLIKQINRKICSCEIPKSYKGIKLPEGIKNETFELIKGCLNGSRVSLSRAITLLESERWDHSLQGDYLLDFITSYKRKTIEEEYGKGFKPAAFRLGITGPPGAGKSTFVEAFGKLLTKKGYKVSVLCIDPSSILTGGSLLGDKTRMIELSVDPNAYVRPSPSNGDLGGVTEHTADLVLLTESVGYDFVIVETVGLGQSEVVVDDMVDMFVLVMPPSMGDSLQGVKKGIMEHADAVIINKSDMVQEETLNRVLEENRKGLEMLGQKAPNWKPSVFKCSAIKKKYLDDIYDCVEKFWKSGLESGEMEKKRKWQNEAAMWSQMEKNVFIFYIYS